MTNIIMIPGYGGSGELHWQTLWERSDPTIARILPRSWDSPDLSNWLDALDCAVGMCGSPPILIAHSLGCLLVAHWSRWTRYRLRGAFLVSVPDPKGIRFPKAASSFEKVPTDELPFPALIVASADDPFASPEFTERCAEHWKAQLVVAGALGHINASRGLGDWPQGLRLLGEFIAGLNKRPAPEMVDATSGGRDDRSRQRPHHY